MKKLKDLSFLFAFALFGAGIYELVVYLSDPYSPNWSNLISEMLIVSLLVSVVLLVIKTFVKRPDN